MTTHRKHFCDIDTAAENGSKRVNISVYQEQTSTTLCKLVGKSAIKPWAHDLCLHRSHHKNNNIWSARWWVWLSVITRVLRYQPRVPLEPYHYVIRGEWVFDLCFTGSTHRSTLQCSQSDLRSLWGSLVLKCVTPAARTS